MQINVNGRPHEVAASSDTPLLYVLRNELALNGAKFGCGLAQCGACTVHVGDTAMRACVMPVSAVNGPVTTIEGLGTADKPHPLQAAFVAEQAAQCGYCINGMVMSAAALLKQNPKPDETELRRALDGNLCRCGTHLRILRAVRRVAGTGDAPTAAAPAASAHAAATTRSTA
jgi:nicotinate dehydrogenase subunit A